MKDELTKELAVGARVRYTYQEMLENSAHITAQVEGHAVLQMDTLTGVKNPLGHDLVEPHFEDEISREVQHSG